MTEFVMVPMPADEQDVSDAECACVTLRGAAERMLMILNHRQVRVYDTAIQSVERAIAEWRAAAAKVSQHTAGCATNNAPALPPGPCDCGAEIHQDNDPWNYEGCHFGFSGEGDPNA